MARILVHGVAAWLFLALPATAQAPQKAGLHLASELPRDVEVLGEVHAQWQGRERLWLTLLIPPSARNAEQGTARWESFDIGIIPQQPDIAESFGVDPEALSAEERAYFEHMFAQLAERQEALLSALAADVSWSVQAHDPENPNLLTEGVLSIEPMGMGRSAEEWAAELGRPLPVSINYVAGSSSGLPSLLYVSDYEDGGDGVAVLDTLSLDAPFGHVSGQFSGTLCRVDMAIGRIDVDADDCHAISGRFDTELFAAQP